MSTIVITDEVAYQIGVDILGFPVYHLHLFAKEYITEVSTNKKGKNMSKSVEKHRQHEYVFNDTVTQF